MSATKTDIENLQSQISKNLENVISNLTKSLNNFQTNLGNTQNDVNDNKSTLDTHFRLVSQNIEDIDKLKTTIMNNVTEIEIPLPNNRYTSYINEQKFDNGKDRFPKIDITNKIVFWGSSTFRFWHIDEETTFLDPSTNQFEGYSIYTGLDVNADEQLSKSFPDYEVVNYGIGGGVWQDGLEYTPKLFSKNKPKAVCTFFGTNDIYFLSWNGIQDFNQNPIKNCENFLKWMELNCPNTQIIMLAITPTLARANIDNANLLFNKAQEHFSTKYKNVHFIDSIPALEAIDPSLNSFFEFPSVFGKVKFPNTPYDSVDDIPFGDGLHLSYKGYEVLRDLFLNKFQSLNL